MTGCFPTEENILANCTCRCHSSGKFIKPNCCECSTYNKNYNHNDIESPEYKNHELVQSQIESAFKRLNALTDMYKSITIRIDELEKWDVSSQLQRITKLEEHYYSDGDLSAIHGQIDNIHNNDEHRDHEIERLGKIVVNLERNLELILNYQKKINQPYKCPLCEGFWDSPCKACDGKGIVWG